MAGKNLSKYRKPPAPVNRPLTTLELRFVLAYVELLNVGAAAEKAQIHYQTAVEYMKSPHVVAEIQERVRGAFEKASINSDRVAQELAAMAFACIFDFIEVKTLGKELGGDEVYVIVKSMDDIPPHMRGAISGISVTPGRYGQTIKVQMHDKMAALRMLASLTGLVAKDGDKEVEDEKNYQGAPPEALKALVQQMGKIARKIGDGEDTASMGDILPFAKSLNE